MVTSLSSDIATSAREETSTSLPFDTSAPRVPRPASAAAPIPAPFPPDLSHLTVDKGCFSPVTFTSGDGTSAIDWLWSDPRVSGYRRCRRLRYGIGEGGTWFPSGARPVAAVLGTAAVSLPIPAPTTAGVVNCRMLHVTMA